VFAVVIVGAIVDYVVGVFMGPQTEEQYARGFVGLNGEFKKKMLLVKIFKIALQ
jgi:hypothetical protein